MLNTAGERRAGMSDQDLAEMGDRDISEYAILQIVARPWRDDIALAVAAYLEERFGGWQPPSLSSEHVAAYAVR